MFNEMRDELHNRGTSENEVSHLSGHLKISSKMVNKGYPALSVQRKLRKILMCQKYPKIDHHSQFARE